MLLTGRYRLTRRTGQYSVPRIFLFSMTVQTTTASSIAANASTLYIALLVFGHARSTGTVMNTEPSENLERITPSRTPSIRFLTAALSSVCSTC